MPDVNCYDVPQYWDLAFGEDTSLEADFVEAAGRKYCDFAVRRLLEPGCGGGRLIVELARRGYAVTGWDLSRRAVEYAREQSDARGLSADVSVRDMTQSVCDPPCDVAYCLVNTFRHLLTEEDAVRHLKCMAESVRPGGLYILGLHLFPPDADEEDEEEWSHTENGVAVSMRLTVSDCSRQTRLETLQFEMTVSDPAHPGPQCFRSDYRMRLYEASQFTQLLSRVPEFQLLDVFDFWYDIEQPLTLSDELGDTVFVLRRT